MNGITYRNQMTMAAAMGSNEIHLQLPAAAPSPPGAVPPPPAAASTRPRAEDTERNPSAEIRERFEARVSRTKNGALCIASLHLLSRFLGFCALTWATVVLLGGFASALRAYDFLLISTILLVDGIRLFFVQIFSKLLSTLALFRESQRPEYFQFKDMQHIKASRLDILGRAITLLLAFASIISTVVRFILRRRHPLSGISSPGNFNLSKALYIFYVLVLVNSSLEVLYVLVDQVLRRLCDASPLSDHEKDDEIRQNWLVRFHNEVIRTAIEVGLAEAHDLDILEFAYTKISSDYKRYIRPPLIKAHNRDLIRYLYHNKQGVEVCCEHLKSSSDVWKRVVAASLPGFWAGEYNIEMQLGLFWALSERIHGEGKVARSALDSIRALGEEWADLPKTKQYPFLMDDPAIANSSIVSRLVRLLIKSIRPTLIFQLGALEACCRNAQVLQHLYGGKSPQQGIQICMKLQDMIVGGELKAAMIEDGDRELQELCCKLSDVVKSKRGIWLATKIYAASALLALLSYGAESLSSKAIESLKEMVDEFIQPANLQRTERGGQPYLCLSDLDLLEKIRSKLGMESYGARWKGVRIVLDQSGVELSSNEVQEYLIRRRSTF